MLARRHRRLVLLVFLVLALVAPACVPQPPPPGGAVVEEVVFSGLTQPTAVRFAKDGRVFVAEKSGLIKVFDSLTDTTPTVFADLRTAGVQLLGPWASGSRTRPAVPFEPLGVRLLHARRRDRRDRTPVGITRWDERSVPDAAGSDPGWMCRQRAVVPPAGLGQRHGRSRAGADRRLVPAVPEPLDRRPRLRSRRRALRQWRRRRVLRGDHRLRPVGRSPEPVRRSARARRRHANDPVRRRRRAALAGPPEPQ